MFPLHGSNSEQSRDATSDHFRALGKTVVTLRKCRPQIRVYFYIVYILFTTLHAHMFRIIKCTNNLVISFSKTKEQQKKKK